MRNVEVIKPIAAHAPAAASLPAPKAKVQAQVPPAAAPVHAAPTAPAPVAAKQVISLKKTPETPKQVKMEPIKAAKVEAPASKDVSTVKKELNNALSKLKDPEPKAPTSAELTKALDRKNSLNVFKKVANDTDKLKKTILKASISK